MQQPFYFDHRGQPLFGLYFPPQGQPSGRGYVLCSGFGKEYNLCLSHLVGFARMLAARGHAVLRFDYRGYGDSTGQFEQATVGTMCADIEQALAQLGQRAGVQRFGLVGVRFGAALAVEVAARREDVEQLILWEPVLKPWDYLFAELRQTVTMQTVLFRAIKITRDQIVENVLGGRPSLVEGYDMNIIDEGFPLGAGMIREAQGLNIFDPVPDGLRARTLVLNIRKKEGPTPKWMVQWAERLQQAGGNCRLDTATEPCTFWKYDNIYATRGPEMYARTLAWIEEG